MKFPYLTTFVAAVAWLAQPANGATTTTTCPLCEAIGSGAASVYGKIQEEIKQIPAALQIPSLVKVEGFELGLSDPVAGSGSNGDTCDGSVEATVTFTYYLWKCSCRWRWWRLRCNCGWSGSYKVSEKATGDITIVDEGLAGPPGHHKYCLTDLNVGGFPYSNEVSMMLLDPVLPLCIHAAPADCPAAAP